MATVSQIAAPRRQDRRRQAGGRREAGGGATTLLYSKRIPNQGGLGIRITTVRVVVDVLGVVVVLIVVIA
eukprot:6383312-Pyramimonas_sp.AAC.1